MPLQQNLFGLYLASQYYLAFFLSSFPCYFKKYSNRLPRSCCASGRPCFPLHPVITRGIGLHFLLSLRKPASRSIRLILKQSQIPQNHNFFRQTSFLFPVHDFPAQILRGEMALCHSILNISPAQRYSFLGFFCYYLLFSFKATRCG